MSPLKKQNGKTLFLFLEIPCELKGLSAVFTETEDMQHVDVEQDVLSPIKCVAQWTLGLQVQSEETQSKN